MSAAAKVGADDFAAAGGDLAALAESAIAVEQFDVPEQRKSASARLVELAADFDLFRDPAGEAYATFAVRDHRETHRLRSRAVRDLLAGRLYQGERRAASSQALQDALAVLSAQALLGGVEHQVSTRVVHVGDTVYLDLADARWRCVEIDTNGWRIRSDAPVRFRRSRGPLALPEPVPGGSLEGLRRLVNVATDDDWRLLVSWLVGTLSPGPYPILALQGEHGAAKSMAARMLRRLVDPNVAELRSAPRDTRDLIIAATNGHVVALDNLSRVPAALSDDLCRLATGGGFGTRELYSDGEETLFNAMRPTIINGITELATRGDLLDRVIVLTLPPVEEDKRLPEAELWADFEAARPVLLGALLDAVSCALCNRATTRLDKLPRMADFALWVVAAEPSLGWKPGTFIASYTKNRADANETALDASPIVAPLRAVLDAAGADAWTGEASVLLAALSAHVDDRIQRMPSWPKDGTRLSRALRRLAPNLRATGVGVEFSVSHHPRLITLSNEACKSASPASLASQTAPSSTNGEDLGDAGGRWGTLMGRSGDADGTPYRHGDAGAANSHEFSKSKVEVF